MHASIMRRTWSSIRIPVISLFVLYHVAALVLWIAPPFPLYWSILPTVRPYVCYFGFWNQWKMFCHPKKWNVYLTANVTMEDGSVQEWEFPRMDKLDYMTRMQKERYRKWSNDYVNEGKFKLLMPETCKFIARQMNNSTSKPAKISLVRHWSYIQTPPGMGPQVSTKEQSYTFYTHAVTAEDLK